MFVCTLPSSSVQQTLKEIILSGSTILFKISAFSYSGCASNRQSIDDKTSSTVWINSFSSLCFNLTLLMTLSTYLFFRDYPFDGGYAIACGVEEITQYIANFKFSKEDLKYLSSINGTDGKPIFSSDFLKFLKTMKLELDIDCVAEGTVVFPHEPVLRVCGPILHCQIVETAILNAFNFQTLVATKASRICRAANCPVSEFGLRRAQGYAGGI